MSSEDTGQRGQQWLQDILQAMGYPARVDARAEATGETTWLIIEAEGLTDRQQAALLDERGRSLDALQYLANISLNPEADSTEEQRAFTVEFAGYRQQRQQELAELAERAVRQLQAEGGEVEIKDLTAFERRQMHNTLKSYDGIETYSRGQEPNRHLIVRLSTAET